MTEIVLGVAMLVSSTGISPAAATPQALVVPAAFTFELPDGAATSRNLPHRLPNEQSRPVWRRGSLQAAQTMPANRPTRIERILVIAAGSVSGFWAGGAIGFYATPKKSKYDDVSGLKGMMIGAPIGALVGAVIGHRLTK